MRYHTSVMGMSDKKVVCLFFLLRHIGHIDINMLLAGSSINVLGYYTGQCVNPKTYRVLGHYIDLGI